METSKNLINLVYAMTSENNFIGLFLNVDDGTVFSHHEYLDDSGIPKIKERAVNKKLMEKIALTDPECNEIKFEDVSEQYANAEHPGMYIKITNMEPAKNAVSMSFNSGELIHLYKAYSSDVSENIILEDKMFIQLDREECIVSVRRALSTPMSYYYKSKRDDDVFPVRGKPVNSISEFIPPIVEVPKEVEDKLKRKENAFRAIGRDISIVAVQINDYTGSFGTFEQVYKRSADSIIEKGTKIVIYSTKDYDINNIETIANSLDASITSTCLTDIFINHMRKIDLDQILSTGHRYVPTIHASRKH